MDTLIKSALCYRRAGLSVVVIDKNKKPIHYWQKYRNYHINENKLLYLLKQPKAFGIGVVCGAISKNLGVIDIDEKNRIGDELFQQLMAKLNQQSPELVPKLTVASTKNCGFHLYFISDFPSKSQILARRLCTNEELIRNPKQKVKVLIETIGSGKFVIVPPTPGYQFLQRDLMLLAAINELEKEVIFKEARSFNQFKDSPLQSPLTNYVDLNADSPFGDYNLRGDILSLLIKHGWKYVERKGERTYLQRPGETDHATSGDFHHSMKLFKVFSTSTDFVPDKGYKPYAVYAILECAGDFKHAAKRLLSEGYGIAYRDRINI